VELTKKKQNCAVSNPLKFSIASTALQSFSLQLTTAPLFLNRRFRYEIYILGSTNTYLENNSEHK